MSTTLSNQPALSSPRTYDASRLSTRFGLAFAICQLGVMVCMSIFVLPHGGSPHDSALVRGNSVHDADTYYRVGNYVFMISGILLLGFLGAVGTRLRRVDPSGALAGVAVAAGTLVALVWPMAAMLHDVALDTAAAGTDPRILGAWDAVAPYSLAFSALPRLFLVGALVLGMRAVGATPWLTRAGVGILVLSAVGSATLLTGDMFPVLALSTLAFEVWVGAVAFAWLRDRTAPSASEVRR
ncbi:hypothetical protein GCM10009798_00830 [Nocardioides panacihumi]|uniref:DUF4386 domain-containing protein n=1 Tax=Nocardioides panacihumi TaxID=400774 RepID=A0ABP5BIN4_9ACTN